MTIAVVWVRKLESGAEELLFCSDSRLSGGKRFDHCQKVFRFTRTDAAICFAGETDWAYPMIVAAVTASDLHVPSQTRALPLAKFKAHVVNILNQMQREVHNFAEGEQIPRVKFIFGGYDWWYKCFRIWGIEFSSSEGVFRSHERTGSNAFGGLGKLEMAGDLEWIRKFRFQLKSKVQARYGLDMCQPSGARFNMEPFEVIRDLLQKAGANDSIGGAPQGVKIYQFMNSADIGFFWPSTNAGRLCVSGRPLLDYERATIKSVVDPESSNSTWSSGNSEVARAQIVRANEKESDRNGSDDIPELDERK